MADFDVEELDFGDPELQNESYENAITEGMQPDEPAPQEPDATPPQDAQGDSEPGDDAAAVAEPSDGTDGAAQPAQQQQAPEPTEPAVEFGGRLRTDKQGNLRNADNQIVAKAGRERRFLEQNERMRQYSATLEAQLRDAKGAAEQIKQIAGMPAEHNLQPQEVQMGMQIMGEFKKNPMAVAQWALKETLAMGHNLQQIVGEGAQGVEMSAIGKMIDDRVGPVVQHTQQRTQADAARQNAQNQYVEFMAKHDHANVHEAAIVGVMKKQPGSTPETVYWQLREYATRHGLDFTQPLGPQLQQRRAPQQQAQPVPAPAAQPQTPQMQPQPNVPPMPRGVSSAPVEQQVNGGVVFADANEDWDRIVADSMHSAGYQT